jgi:hypothetical protein
MSKSNIVRIEKSPSVYVISFLSLITAFFYLFHFYDKLVANLNYMAKIAIGDNASKVKYSATYFYAALSILYIPFIFVGSVFVIYNFVDVNFVNTIPIETVMLVIMISLISDVVFLVYALKLLRDVRAQIIEIALQYGRFDIAKRFQKKITYFNATDRGFYKAFNDLVEEHNKYADG